MAPSSVSSSAFKTPLGQPVGRRQKPQGPFPRVQVQLFFRVINRCSPLPAGPALHIHPGNGQGRGNLRLSLALGRVRALAVVQCVINTRNARSKKECTRRMLERLSCSGPKKSAIGVPVDNCYMRHRSRLSLMTALRCCAVHHNHPILHNIPVQPYGDGTVSLSFHRTRHSPTQQAGAESGRPRRPRCPFPPSPRAQQTDETRINSSRAKLNTGRTRRRTSS